MKTKIFKNTENIGEAGKIIRAGGLVAFPTETVYGLGASAYDESAAEKIYAAKGRPSDNPLIVHVCSKEQIRDVAAEIPDAARRLIDAFLPGPLTLILKKGPRVSESVTAGLDTVAVRFPAHKTAQALIRAAGVPVAAPSANISGRPSPTTARDVAEDMDGRIDAVIDGGDCEVGVESTIADMTRGGCVILRPGGVTLEMIREILPEAELDKNIMETMSGEEKPPCPGMKYRHYAPKADMTVVEGGKEAVRAKMRELISADKGKKIGALVMYGADYDDAVMIDAGGTSSEYAHRLFAALREFDRLGIEKIYAEFNEDGGVGTAVKNRLYKAAGHKVIHV